MIYVMLPLVYGCKKLHLEYFNWTLVSLLCCNARKILRFCTTKKCILVINIYLLVARDICRTKVRAARIRRAPNL